MSYSKEAMLKLCKAIAAVKPRPRRRVKRSANR